MSTRNTVFANEEYYHIFNRGTDKREIFSSPQDYERFEISLDLLNDDYDGLMIEWRNFKQSNPLLGIEDFLKVPFRKRDPLVKILAYCLNPNHYHLVLQQLKEKGIERYLHKLGVSHTKFYNNKYARNGSLFQGVFKSVHIDSNDYLLYLSTYVNNNNFIHGYSNDDSWPHCSLPAYLGKRTDGLVSKETIASQFSNIADYSSFMKANANYMKEKKALARYMIEE